METIILSIRPQYVKLIAEGKKDHEFRKRNPKRPFSRVIIYTSGTKREIRYIAEVGMPVSLPEKISGKGIGNEDYNAGRKEEKYAIPIIHLHELEKSLPLDMLRKDFGFTPPQGFCYASAYSALSSYLLRADCRRLF